MGICTEQNGRDSLLLARRERAAVHKTINTRPWHIKYRPVEIVFRRRLVGGSAHTAKFASNNTHMTALVMDIIFG